MATVYGSGRLGTDCRAAAEHVSRSPRSVRARREVSAYSGQCSVHPTSKLTPSPVSTVAKGPAAKRRRRLRCGPGSTLADQLKAHISGRSAPASSPGPGVSSGLQMRTFNIPTSIDLFCGAGGLTLGLDAAGFRTVLGCDNWSPAVATFSANFPGTPVWQADIRDLTGPHLLERASLREPPALIAGGPPCQGFSSAGARRDGDHRNTLVAEFARLVSEVRPLSFFFENVEGFLTAGRGEFVFDLLDPLIDAGYSIVVRKVNVANWGVPQLRKRVIALGMLHGRPPFPTPTHRAWGSPGAHRVGSRLLPASPTIMDALNGLPPAADLPPGIPSGHYAARLSKADTERIASLRPGQTMRDLPEHLWHPSYQRRANRRVADGMPTERRGGAPAGLRRLRPDEPAKAVTSAASREFIHPQQDRPLTLRECARLQTFPDAFHFCGVRSESSILVGNALPPLFAQRVAEQLQRALTRTSPDRHIGGQLVRFDVTNAEGMSPALRSVNAAVLRRYGRDEQLHFLDVG